MTRLFLSFVILFALSSMNAFAAEKRLALVVANEDYPATVGKLSNTHKDASVVEAALLDVGFVVEKVLDADRRTFALALQQFRKDIDEEAADGDDVVAFFYASMHGASAPASGRTRNFLLPAKQEYPDCGQIVLDGIRIDELIDGLETTKAKAIFVVSDACRNSLQQSCTKSAQKGFVAEPTGKRVLLAYATSPGSTTPDDGLFAKILAEEIRKPGRKAAYAITDVAGRVANERSFEGQPWFSPIVLPPDLCFNGCESAKVAADIARLEELNAAIVAKEQELTALADNAVDSSGPDFVKFSEFLLEVDRTKFEQFGDRAPESIIRVISSRKDILANFQIDSPKRLSQFLAHMHHESAGFTQMEENLNYSGTALWRVFRKFFASEAEATKFARQPEKIANRVYANRIGNGPEESGDGFRYRGRGFLQLTGRANYELFAQALGLDLVSNPDLALDPEVAFLVAAFYWNNNGLNELADQSDIESITRRLIGASHGISDRKAQYNRAAAIFGAPKID